MTCWLFYLLPWAVGHMQGKKEGQGQLRCGGLVGRGVVGSNERKEDKQQQ
jgi:hypothetical protein